MYCIWREKCKRELREKRAHMRGGGRGGHIRSCAVLQASRGESVCDPQYLDHQPAASHAFQEVFI